jgi:hypothetical protein
LPKTRLCVLCFKLKEKIRKGKPEVLERRRIRDRERLLSDPVYKSKKDLSRKKSAKNKRNIDTTFRCRKDVSRAIYSGLKSQNGSKNNISCWLKLPYTPIMLMNHLESHFVDCENLTPDGKVWMNRLNRGSYTKSKWDDNDPKTWVWSIDHIVPQSELPYDSYDHPNFQKCWALENLRPLSAKQNLLDGVLKTRHKNVK